MRNALIALITAIPLLTVAQISASQQKCLNAYVEYANQSAEAITAVVKSIIDYYPQLERKNFGTPRYACPIQLSNYYLKNITDHRQSLPVSVSSALDIALENLHHSEQAIDQKCKSLDTYHKLEDFKQDNFANARALINDLQVLVKEYKKKQSAFQAVIEETFKQYGGSLQGNPYRKADFKMLMATVPERKFLDSWTFNLRQEIHTAWSVVNLLQSISETDSLLNILQQENPPLAYPASGMWSHFQESLSSILSIKNAALDGYNYEAKRTDKHSNDAYMELVNYLNGTLIADYNTFIQFSERDGYCGLKTIKYVPGFEIRTQPEDIKREVKPFKDNHAAPLKITPAKNPISKTVFESLSNYVELINESWRQVSSLQSTLSSFNSSAVYYESLTSYDRKGPMHFDYSDYQLPLSFYQKTLNDSKALPPGLAKALNEQTEIILNILKEMDDLTASLDVEVKEKYYEQDHLKKVFTILERQSLLFQLWDDKKEQLYDDVRAIYNSFPASSSDNAWHISGNALRTLTDLDRDALFKAKAFYKGDSTVIVTTDEIDLMLREVIAKEYDNMKGIQKIGRNNGLCPYTPYEDLPETSKQLSEHFKKIKHSKSSSGYHHPYHNMVYLYNDIADDYNKFCELSTTVYHLKTIKQPELFFIKYPETKASEGTISLIPDKSVSSKNGDNIRAQKPVSVSKENEMGIVHDTIFMEKRDTVYVSTPREEFQSMEGYATNNMILLLDVSGSMNQPKKLPLLKQSVLDMLAMMRKEDRVSIIAFSGKPKILLKPSSFKDEAKIREAVNNLSSSGKTDGDAGLKLAYKLADENYIRGGNNRIILATDGEFVLNDQTLTLVEKFSKQDIFLSVFNFGKGMASSVSLADLATMGKGNYEIISDESIELKLIREAKAKRKK